MTRPPHGKTVIIAFFLQTIFSVTHSGEVDIALSTTEEGHNDSTCYDRIHQPDESEFPEDLFTEEQRAQGAIVLHVILAVYCFVAIATVCTEYFLPTIRCICQDLKVSDDVAAATFMSMATSAPELFTSIIGTFITESDIGIGHVLGNAYYDMFFVASVGGLLASKEIPLDWWPITRDCFVYLVISAALTAVVWDGIVQTHEAVILLSMYILYFIIMFSNRRIIKFGREKFNLDMNDPVQDDVVENGQIKVMTIMSVEHADEDDDDLTKEAVKDTSVAITQETYYAQQEGSTAWWKMVVKFLHLPLSCLISTTIPDVRDPRYRRFYPITFVICVIWIGISTYFGTWMISVIGHTIGVPDSIMGLVFMAAGGSVVEVYAVYVKVRQGECTIGLSNSMGCNCMDITLCLALPWLIKSLLHPYTGAVVLASSGLHINCGLLIISVILLYVLFCITKFRLNKVLGALCGTIYVGILILAIMVLSQDRI